MFSYTRVCSFRQVDDKFIPCIRLEIAFVALKPNFQFLDLYNFKWFSSLLRFSIWISFSLAWFFKFKYSICKSSRRFFWSLFEFSNLSINSILIFIALLISFFSDFNFSVIDTFALILCCRIVFSYFIFTFKRLELLTIIYKSIMTICTNHLTKKFAIFLVLTRFWMSSLAITGFTV